MHLISNSFVTYSLKPRGAKHNKQRSQGTTGQWKDLDDKHTMETLTNCETSRASPFFLTQPQLLIVRRTTLFAH